MINCKDIQEKIIQGILLNSEEQTHLLHCRSCQDFSAAYGIATAPRQTTEVIPPAIQAAWAKRKQCTNLPRSSETPLPRFGTPGLHLGRVLLPVAAAAVIMLLCWTMLPGNPSTKNPRHSQIAARADNHPTPEDRWAVTWAATETELLELENLLTSD